MIVKFLCGCTSKKIITRENLKTMDRIGYDEEGFVICLDHRERRYGWRSAPQMTLVPDDPTDATRTIYVPGSLSWTPLQVEGYVLFGE